MPFWAYYMIACIALVLWGWRVSQWRVPALILCGLIGVRLTPIFPETIHEIASCTVWMTVTYAVLAHRKHLQAFLLGISTVTYPIFLILGYGIEYMGVQPIVSDAFLILAILASGHDVFRSRHNSRSIRRPDFLLPCDQGISSLSNPRIFTEDRPNR